MSSGFGPKSPCQLQRLAGIVVGACSKLNSFIASDDFCHLLITFTNNLGQDQDRLNARPDLHQTV